jgi:nucleoid DNA-binding protein
MLKLAVARNDNGAKMTTRQKLIDRLSKIYPELSRQDIYEVVLGCFDNISEELSKGNRIEIRGFGTLDVVKRNVVSPFKHVSKSIQIRKTVQYKASKNILEEVN